LDGDQPVARSLPTHRTTQTQNKRTQTSMPRVGFEPTNPVSEETKTVHDLDRAATVVGCSQDTLKLNNISSFVTCYMTHDHGAC
jgi:DICT domain-containing protein